jgi:hypothetical protein
VLPTLHPVIRPLVAPWGLLIHTDGVSHRFDVAELLAATEDDIDQLAPAILARWARATDDATVVAARPR